MKTKKIAAVLLTCIMAIGLMAGCGASNTNQSASNTENTSTGNGKTLVVYYSASGNTKDVAEKIAKITEADLFEIEPVEPYTDDDLDWTDDDSRVSREHDDESLRDVELVSTTVDNWDSYDTVYIGYPIWWGEAPRIIDTFMEAYDFSGKTIVPFCTSGGSGIGSSARNLHNLAGSDVIWLDGKRLSSDISHGEMVSWIDGLSLDVMAQ